jgi:glycosyltransferase involved in cell wall biosynthesis
MTRPLVSVCIITYNQEKYIAQCLDSVLAQQCSFPVQIYIGDDCSTDSTSSVIRTYMDRHPGRISYHRPEKNLGMHRNWLQSIQACEGHYVALLEGDDYWTDPSKLQKQVEHMNQHPTHTVCFTNAEVKNEVSERAYPLYVEDTGKTEFTLSDLLRFNLMPTCTVLYRKEALRHIPDAYFKSPYADWILHSLYAQQGSIGYIPLTTGCYRLHPQGVFGGSGELKRIRNAIKCYDLLETFVKGNKELAIIREERRKRYHQLSTRLKEEKKWLEFLLYRLYSKIR